MIVTSLSLTISGNSYEEILEKAKESLSNFFDIPTGEIDKKVNIEIRVKDLTESLEFDEDDYVAEVIAQVKNV